MILISHRGNLNGKVKDENKPNLIEEVISLGFDVEVDLRLSEKILFLGHDFPQYQISVEWLKKNSNHLWVHCKDLKTLEFLSNHKILNSLNYFFHDNDEATITSKGYLWVYPGLQPVKNSIAVLPELNNENISTCTGICSDYISNYKK